MAKKTLKHLVVDRLINLEHWKTHQEPQPNGCINWTGVTSNVGYGFVGFSYADGRRTPSGNDGGMMTTHRLAWMIKHDRLPTKRNINHTCHNKLCLNPDHLVEGTQQDKLKQMRRDDLFVASRPLGTSGYAYCHKQKNRVYKYTETDIDFIRTAEIEDIARRYNITRPQALRKRWSFRRGYQWHTTPEAK
jgi:hypothetical protein